MYFNFIVKRKDKFSNLFQIFLCVNSKIYKLGYCKVDNLANYYYFVNIKKILFLFFKYYKNIIKFRISFKFSKAFLKSFFGFLKLFFFFF